MAYYPVMSFKEVLLELPALTLEQRQLLVRRVLELDESPLSKQEETLVQSRLNKMRADPSSTLSLKEMKLRIRSQAR